MQDALPSTGPASSHLHERHGQVTAGVTNERHLGVQNVMLAIRGLFIIVMEFHSGAIDVRGLLLHRSEATSVT